MPKTQKAHTALLQTPQEVWIKQRLLFRNRNSMKICIVALPKKKAIKMDVDNANRAELSISSSSEPRLSAWQGSLLSGQLWITTFDLTHCFSKGIKKIETTSLLPKLSECPWKAKSVKFAGASSRNLLGIAPQSLSRAELDKHTRSDIPVKAGKGSSSWMASVIHVYSMSNQLVKHTPE